MPRKRKDDDHDTVADTYQRLPHEQELSNTGLRKERKKQSKARREKEGILEAELNKKNMNEHGIVLKKSKVKETNKKVNDIEDDENCSLGIQYNLSIAVPGSIIDNAQTWVLKTYLAGQIARAAAIFKVSEIIVYDDTAGQSTSACKQMVRILQYLECPQYLRKHVFPIHEDLQYIGVVCPLDIPHHLRQHEFLPYREGVITTKPMKKGQTGSLVNIGLQRDVKIDQVIKIGTRVTVELNEKDLHNIKTKLKGTLVSPLKPRQKNGIYWGYTVRLASNLSEVFLKCPFSKNYDMKIGTSEKGTPLHELKLKKSNQNYLIVFGGVEGLEYALENDETLVEDNVANLFDHYLNTCPFQGSRTIRTEEAILITMSALSSYITNTYE